MGKHKRGSKNIGRSTKHSKLQSQNRPKLPRHLRDHTYAAPAVDNSNTIDPEHILQPICRFAGNFDNCLCVVHDSEVTSDIHEQTTENCDSDGFYADEFFLVVGTSAQKYNHDNNLDHVTLGTLKQSVVSNESVLTNLNLNIARTTEQLHLVQFYEHESLEVKLAVTVNLDLTPVLTVHGKRLPSTHPVFRSLQTINIFDDLMALVSSLQDYAVCVGNSDPDYISHYSSKGKAYLEVDCGADYGSTIRADTCSLLTPGARCSACSEYRAVLRANESRRRRKSSSSVRSSQEILSSKKTNCTMSRLELETKQKLLKAKNKNLELQNKRLRIQSELQKDKYQAMLSEQEAGEMNELVTQCTPDVETMFPDPNSFQRIFWEEQIKYNNLKCKSAMRWHPLIVKWALLMRSKSSKAYLAMKDSGFLNLPSERTLYDYSHCIPSKLGFVPEAIDMLLNECKQKGLFDQPWKSYVGLLQDEIKVKDDLVYCPTTGQLIGYVNLDEVSDQIIAFENGVNGTKRELATSALVVMVRGAATDLKFPLAAFSTHGLDADQLYSILWRSVELLEIDVGLKVLFITCDGAGQNRKFFEMHRDPASDEEPVHSCVNIYAEDGRNLYFISDAPHLLKTTRNCFANSNSHHKTRHLWKDGNEILWTHIVRLYEEHIENKLFTKASLNRSHIDLTSFSQMKVNLAAQVLSNHVAAQLEQEYGSDVKETVAFIRHMNKFFDCLNTRHLYEGKHKDNPDIAPYENINDERLVYLEGTFLGYFEDWKKAVESRPGNFTKQERAKMLLSTQTLNGLKITVKSVVACIRLLLQEGAPFVMTEKFNQDILEQHFGHYRHKGGACDNPTIDNIRHTMTTLRVIGSTALAPLRGNTKRKRSEQENHDLVKLPLPRKKSRPTSGKF